MNYYNGFRKLHIKRIKCHKEQEISVIIFMDHYKETGKPVVLYSSFGKTGFSSFKCENH